MAQTLADQLVRTLAAAPVGGAATSPTDAPAGPGRAPLELRDLGDNERRDWPVHSPR